MNIEKYNMIERQLVCRNIREPQIIDAFLMVDRENFVPSMYKKFAYADMDISTGKEATFILRPYTLSKIIQRIVCLQPAKLLVVGDDTRYTTSLLKRIFFSKCHSLSEEEFLHSEIENFDVIFFDSKTYNQTTMKYGKFMLGDSGRMIFFAHSAPLNFFDISRQMSFIDIDVIEKTYDNVDSKLFHTSVFVRER
jgi:hypothetical protein